MKLKKIKARAEGFRFKEAVFLYSEEDYVRKLPGFKVGNKPPKRIDDYHESWIQKIASELIREELDEVTESLRKILKLKLKDFSGNYYRKRIWSTLNSLFRLYYWCNPIQNFSR